MRWRYHLLLYILLAPIQPWYGILCPGLCDAKQHQQYGLIWIAVSALIVFGYLINIFFHRKLKWVVSIIHWQLTASISNYALSHWLPVSALRLHSVFIACTARSRDRLRHCYWARASRCPVYGNGSTLARCDGAAGYGPVIRGMSRHIRCCIRQMYCLSRLHKPGWPSYQWCSVMDLQ